MDNELNSGNVRYAMNRRNILVHFSQELQARVARLPTLPLQPRLPPPPPLEQQPSPQLVAASPRPEPPPVHRSPSRPSLTPRPPSFPPPPPPPPPSAEKRLKTRPRPCIIPQKGDASGKTSHCVNSNAYVRQPHYFKSEPRPLRYKHVQWARG